MAINYNEIAPSVPDALFRRLQRDDKVAYLRHDNGSITGFKVLNSETLSGYTLVALKKQTILCYCDHESEQLILFPSLKDVKDRYFGLADIRVKKVTIANDSFEGKLVEENTLGELIKRYLPPFVLLDLNDDEPLPELDEQNQPIQTNTSVAYESHFEDMPFEAPDFEDGQFDDFEGPSMSDPEPDVDPIALFETQNFDSLSAVGEYVQFEFGLPSHKVTVILNTVLSSQYPNDKKAAIAQGLFARLLRNGDL